MPGVLRRNWPSLAVLFVALAVAVLAAVLPVRLGVNSPEAKARFKNYVGVRIFRDDHDINVYYQRSEYARKPGARPFVDVFSEYPQLATYLMAVPNVAGGTRETYRTVYLLMMALALGGLAAVTVLLCRETGAPPTRAILLLLPGCLYFALCRYDVVAALLTCGALLLLLKGRPRLAFAILALSFLTKAFAVLLVPLFARYTHRHHGWRGVIIAGLVFVGVVAALSLQLALWSGFDAVLKPFVYQLGRAGNPESLFHFLSPLLPAAKVLFLVAQAAPALYFFFRLPGTPRGMVIASVAIVLSFLLFARFHSPQWVLWISPLALAVARSRALFALTVAMDVMTYLFYPVVFDVFGPLTVPYGFILGALAFLRFTMMGLLLADPDLRPAIKVG